ncbi:helix-turn-helix domain-containing protein [Agrobacterium tumefaciens]|uniref:HTH cro/C1-type domain-containing protein n=1 Tax=Agrobacterium tumefaciens TaxID=358 RepID=A0A2L2L8F8_AGRTU|nr:helix-turn-helix transcriptional regulator [Agrobacterium tumefaciens]AVH40634.1 hypothetical protein At1D1609_05820 [Agrobacterium tumefaciens]NSY94582.1 helix-turn-helix transcriptional regulator [Agrobacterium tumefaciens]
MTGAEIKEAREARGWSLERLSTACGVSPQLLAEIECGGAAGQNLNRILKSLGVYVEGDEVTAGTPVKIIDDQPDDDAVVIFDQPQTSVYRNGKGGVVILQKGTRPFDRDEDQFVYFSTDEAVRRLIQALKREIGDA